MMRTVSKNGGRGVADRLLHPTDESDWQCLIHAARPNGLLIGSPGLTAALLRRLAASLQAPVVHWPRDGAPWTCDTAPATLVLHDVAALTRTDQALLLAWLSEGNRRVQVLSLSTERVYPLVESGAFLERLYYCINSVVIECDAPAPEAAP